MTGRKKLWLRMILMGFVILTFASMSTAQDDELQLGTAMTLEDLVVRAEAQGRSDVVGQIALGDIVEILVIEDNFAQIEFEDIQGWVLGRKLINVSGSIPVPRGYHQMIYDSESDRFIMFGGMFSNGEMVNDTWAYDLNTNTWTEMTPVESPAPCEGPMAYDSHNDRAILFKGTQNWPPDDLPPETWAYDYNSDTWVNLNPETSPPALLGARMVYDSESQRMILLGGLDVDALLNNEFVFVTETWVYDFVANEWTQMNPEVSPPGVNYQAMAYDPRIDRVVMVGSNAFEPTDDTWFYDFNSDTWEALTIEVAPGFRDYSAMSYVDSTGQIILFGEGEPMLNSETWAYDSASQTWIPFEPEIVPGGRGRGWHAMAYSTLADRVVVFGGGNNRTSYTLETWTYDPETNTWEMMPN